MTALTIACGFAALVTTIWMRSADEEGDRTIGFAFFAISFAFLIGGFVVAVK